MLFRNALYAMGLALALGGCNSDSGDTPVTASDFIVSLETTDRFDQSATTFIQGEPINMLLSIRNVSADSKTLTFGTSQHFDFLIRDNTGAPVWGWSDGIAFATAFNAVAIAPGEIRGYIITWDQTLAGGSTIAVGRYTLEGKVIGIPTTPSQNLDIQ